MASGWKPGGDELPEPGYGLWDEIFIVINPRAGSYRRDALLKVIRQRWSDFKYAWEIFEIGETQKSEAVAEVVRQAVQGGVQLVVAAGGDGTVASVAGGVIGSRIPLAIIPVGTGNVLARELNIPLEAGAAWDLVFRPHAIRIIDVMRVGEQIYVLNVGLGLSSLIMRDTWSSEKRRWGWLAYLWTGLKKIWQAHPNHFQISMNGLRKELWASEIIITNSGILGNPLFRWDPRIRIDDGHLDLCVIRALNGWEYFRVILNFLIRGQGRKSTVHCMQVWRNVSISTWPALPVQADGEVIGAGEVKVQVVPKALRIVVPGGAVGG